MAEWGLVVPVWHEVRPGELSLDLAQHDVLRPAVDHGLVCVAWLFFSGDITLNGYDVVLCLEIEVVIFVAFLGIGY